MEEELTYANPLMCTDKNWFKGFSENIVAGARAARSGGRKKKKKKKQNRKKRTAKKSLEFPYLLDYCRKFREKPWLVIPRSIRRTLQKISPCPAFLSTKWNGRDVEMLIAGAVAIGTLVYVVYTFYAQSKPDLVRMRTSNSVKLSQNGSISSVLGLMKA